MKQHLLFSLALCWCSLLSFGQYIGENFTQNGDNRIFYNTTSISPLTVSVGSAFTFNQTDVIIPETVTYNGFTYTVTGVITQGFQNRSTLTNITLPNTMKTIGVNAFYNCSNLISVNIPSAVTVISENAFNNCRKLTSATISDTVANPSSLTTIGSSAFSYCIELNAFTLPNSLTSIGTYAFDGCSSLTTMVVPNTITNLEEGTFSYCTGLTSISLPNSLLSIGRFALDSCSSLPAIDIPNSVTTIGYGSFYGCTSLTTLVVPNSVTTIGDYAFEACSGVTSFTLPNTISAIGIGVFDGCSSLTSIEIPTTVTTIGNIAFRNCSSLTTINIPISVTTIGTSVFQNCTGLSSVTVNWPTPLSINANVFQNVPVVDVALYVLTGTESLYDATPVWTDFINITTALSATQSQTDVTCFNGTDGTATVVTSGGIAPITYAWLPTGGNNATASGLAAGNYTCTITDAVGSELIKSFEITQPASIIPTFTQVDPICSGATLAALPTTSNNGIVGTWSPALDNTTTTTYTFTPNLGECGTTATMTIALNPSAPNITYPIVTESFAAGIPITPLQPTNLGGAPIINYTLMPITTLLGSGFANPSGFALDASGNIYVADTNNNSIKRMDATGGNITTIGVGFISPTGIAIDANGNLLVADAGNNLVKRMDALGGNITILGSGFNAPYGVAVDADGNIYVADSNNNAIKKMNSLGDNIVTLGTGFSAPHAVAVDATGTIFVADYNNNAIKKMDASGGNITIIGSGFNRPIGVSLDADGKIYVADFINNSVKRMDADGSNIITLGTGFYMPTCVRIDASGAVFVSDINSSPVKKLTFPSYSITPTLPVGLIFNPATGTISGTPTVGSPLTTYTISTLNLCGTNDATVTFATCAPFNPTITITETAGTVNNDGIICAGTSAILTATDGATYLWNTGETTASITVSPTANTTYNVTATKADGCIGTQAITLIVNEAAPAISYTGVNATYLTGTAITPITLTNSGGLAVGNFAATPVITTIGSGFSSPRGVAIDALGNVIVADFGNSAVRKIAPNGTITVVGFFFQPGGVAVDAGGNIYVSDGNSNGSVIKKIAPNGNITGFATGFNRPGGLAVDALGNVYVADTNNNAIKKIATNGTITSIGSGFNRPNAVAVDGIGNIYVADSFNNAIKRISTTGTITSLASGFTNPVGVAVDPSGNVFVADLYNFAVKKIAPNGTVTSYTSGFSGPFGIAVNAVGKVFVSDLNNNVVKSMTFPIYSIAPALPTGLSFNTSTGTISGTPTLATPSTTYTITTQNSCGTNNTTITFATCASLATPTFTQVDPVCYGSTLAALPTTSNNGIVGIWSPALDNTTTTTYTFTPNSTQCSTTATMTIGVNITPLPTRNMSISGTLCNGATIGTLISKFNNSANVTCYASPSGGAPLNASDLIAPVNSNVTFYITETSNGCESERLAYNAYVNFVTPPNAAVNQTFCTGATVANLVATPGTSGGSAACCLNWYNNPSGGTALTSATLLTSGVYYVGQLHISSCATQRTMVNVTVSSVDQNVTENNGILTATQNSATYQWYQCPNTLLTGETNQDFTPTAVGDYKVIVTVGSCFATSNCVTVSTLASNSFEEDHFNYYPNPTTGILNISYSKEISEINVFNLIGQKVMTQKGNDLTMQLDLSEHSAQTYLVKITSEGATKTIKVVKH